MGVINEEGENVSSSIQVSDGMVELYIKLMCQYSPSEVYSFLQESVDIPNPESILQLCKK
jgi:hypothetical protein